MRRRTFLRIGGASLLAGTGGCLGAASETAQSNRSTAATTGTPKRDTVFLQNHDYPYESCLSLEPGGYVGYKFKTPPKRGPRSEWPYILTVDIEAPGEQRFGVYTFDMTQYVSYKTAIKAGATRPVPDRMGPLSEPAVQGEFHASRGDLVDGPYVVTVDHTGLRGGDADHHVPRSDDALSVRVFIDKHDERIGGDRPNG